MTKSLTQRRITKDIRDAETALDNALLRQARLRSTVAVARRETGSGTAMGDQAIMRLAKSQQTVVAVCGELARAHGNLLKVQQDVRRDEDCPLNGPSMAQDLVHQADAA